MQVWEQFAEEQPFGLIREDYRAGIIAATMANTVVKKPLQATDFMPFYRNFAQEDNSLLDGAEIL